MKSIEEAIKTAIEFETRVRNVYSNALKRMKDEVGQRVFKVLAQEEQHHLDYLHTRLAEWQKTGKVTAERLETTMPPKQVIWQRSRELERRLAGTANKVELELLERTLRVEQETSAFYRSLVDEVELEDRNLFARFLEIEEGHVAIVQAEIDALTHMGFWFDFPEFNLEANA